MGKVAEEAKDAAVVQPADKKEAKSCGCGCNSGTKGK